jgi:hypothetical protein
LAPADSNEDRSLGAELAYLARDRPGAVKIETGAAKLAPIRLASEEAQKPIEHTSCRRDPVGVAIRTEESHSNPDWTTWPALRRLSGAYSCRIAGFLLRLNKTLLDPADGGLRRLDLLAAFWKPGQPLVDEFVAKQLVRGKRQQNLKLLKRQMQPGVFVSRFVA